MSASTRTVQQQTLGNNQLGAALAVVALAIIVAAAIAFGSLNAAKAAPVPQGAIGQPPPAVIDHGWSQAGTSKGVGSTPIDHGSSEDSMSAGPSSVDFGKGGTSMGGWSGLRGVAGPTSTTIDNVDHGARDDAAGKTGSGARRLIAE